MSEHLPAASEATGIPEDLLRRAAEARATADGVSADDLLSAWAGGGAAPAAAPAPAAAEVETAAAAEAETAPEPATDPEPAPAAAAAGPATAPTMVTAPPAPEAVRGSQALDYDAVVTVPTAGISERTAPTTPRWLYLLFVVVPLIGVTYLITFAQGPTCGAGGQLTVDRLTGVVENCDGSEFTSAAGPGGVDIRGIIAEGSSIYAGAPGNCAACHGGQGGGGTGPALNGGAVVALFGACPDHAEWIALGTAGFQSAGIATYGDSAKPVGGGGVMPGFESALTAEQLLAVTLYERVQFGGQDPNEAAVDCGLVEPPADESGDEAESAEASALGG